MPKVETIIDDEGKSLEIINIDNAVGAKGVNNPDDVRVVKALFNHIPRFYRKGKAVGGHSSIGEGDSWNMPTNMIPSPYDGTMWGVVELTKSFQKYANKMLSNYGYRVNVTGTIKPSKGYALVGKNFSTIAALNIFAGLGSRRDKHSYLDQIIMDDSLKYLFYDEDEEYSDD